MRNKHLSDLESVVEHLGQIAKAYSHDNVEYDALLIATYALLFIQESKLKSSFEQFFEEQNAPLTDEQRNLLKRMGLEKQK